MTLKIQPLDDENERHSALCPGGRQDLQKHAFEFNMYPTVNYAMTSNGMKPVAGMTMSMQF